MELVYLVIVIFLIILFYFYYNYSIPAILEDVKYFSHAFFEKINTKSNGSIPKQKKYKILIFTIEDRKNVKYINIHNQNFRNYAKKWNYEYFFFDKLNPKYNIYWNKFYKTRELLLSYKNEYDYIMCIDSDTIINLDYDLSDIINKYNNYIIATIDNWLKGLHNRVANAGVFIIKNNKIGKKFLDDCCFNYEKNLSKCISNSNVNKLNGIRTGVCYEQGVMTIFLKNKYKNYSTFIDSNVVVNTDNCTNKNDYFILHLCGTDEKKRNGCFKKKLKL